MTRIVLFLTYLADNCELVWFFLSWISGVGYKYSGWIRVDESSSQSPECSCEWREHPLGGKNKNVYSHTAPKSCPSPRVSYLSLRLPSRISMFWLKHSQCLHLYQSFVLFSRDSRFTSSNHHWISRNLSSHLSVSFHEPRSLRMEIILVTQPGYLHDKDRQVLKVFIV